MRFSLSSPEEERCQRIEARLNASGKRREREKFFGEALTVLNKCFPGITFRKRSRVELASGDRASLGPLNDRPGFSLSLSKLGTMSPALENDFEAPQQRPEERLVTEKSSVISKRTRTSLLDGMVNSNARLSMVIDKDRDVLRHPGSGVAVSEDRPLSIGNDGWEKSKMRKKRSGIKPDVYITAILEYKYAEYNSSIAPLLPTLPFYNSTSSALDFVHGLRSPLGYGRKVDVPLNITTHMLSTVSINKLPCSPNRTYAGPNGTRLAASMSNISFVLPHIDILEAYYYGIRGVYGDRFPNFPPLLFDFTAKYQPLVLEIPNRSTHVKILEKPMEHDGPRFSLNSFVVFELCQTDVDSHDDQFLCSFGGSWDDLSAIIEPAA
ncbi:hypothetical protein Drorol1_Dr00027283 [Drosera rotundifolia]